jgi:hypothetical protein
MEQMNIDLQALAAAHNLRRGNGRFVGPCPKCGGSSTSDKFVIRDDGGFKCHGCDFKGDIITWLREIEGKTCGEAHELAGKECLASSCAARGTCRMGDGSGRPQRRARSVAPVPPSRVQQVAHMVSQSPAEFWLAWADGLVADSQLKLNDQAEQLVWLAGRGLDAAAVKRFALGWLGHDRRVQRAAIGLPPKEGKDKLWVPGGLVIPIFWKNGHLHRLRIRRTPESRERFLPDRKYVWIEGSGNEPLVILPTCGPSRGVVVVEAELDAMAVAVAHSGVTVISLGTVAGGMPEWMRRECADAPVILVALDADPGRNGKIGSGPKAISSWTNTYRHAKFWPVPSGKDPGDYVKDHGGDLRAWIEAGLPAMVSGSAPIATASAPSQDLPLSLDASREGGRGVEIDKELTVNKSEPRSSEMAVFIERLRRENGVIWRGEHELAVRYREPQATAFDAQARREKIRAELYGGSAVARLLELLPPGKHAVGGLESFFKGA